MSCRRKLRYSTPKGDLPLEEVELEEDVNSSGTVARKRFSHFSFGDASTDVTELSSILEEAGQYMQSIEIYRLNKRILDCLSHHCRNVTQVKLINSSNIFNSFEFGDYKPFLKNITSLEIRKGEFFFSRLDRVERYQNFDQLLIALKEVNALESLKIELIEISPQTFDHLKSITNLKCLHLIRQRMTTSLPPFIPNFPHLKELLLSYEDSKTHEIIGESIVTCENGINS